MNFYDNTQILNIIIVILIILILYLIFFNQENFATPVCKDASTYVTIPNGCTFTQICSTAGKTNSTVTGVCNNKKISYTFTNCPKVNNIYQLGLDSKNNLVCNPRTCKKGILTTDNTCIKCDNGQTLVDGKCISCQNGTISGNTCSPQCTLLTLNGKLIGSNTLNTDNSCSYTLSGNICPNNYSGASCATTISSMICSKGTLNSTLNICSISTTLSGYTCTNNVCTNNTPSGFKQVNNVAVPIICPVGYTLSGTICQVNYSKELKLNTTTNKLEYACPAGTTLSNGRCNINNNISCKSGYTRTQSDTTGRYYCSKSCDADETLVSGKCKKTCPIGYIYSKVNNGTVCTPICPINFKSGTTLTNNKKSCVASVCPNKDYLHLDATTNKCMLPSLTNISDVTHDVTKYICPNGFVQSSDGKICVATNDNNLNSITSYLSVVDLGI